MDIAKLIQNPGKWLRTLVRSKVDTQPVWNTPNPWADEGGMYAGHDQAWVYRRLPARILRDPALLDATLLTLAQGLPGRDVHLLLHAWEHLQEPEASTPAQLAAFQKASMRFLVPTRSAAIGVQLHPATGKKPSLADEAFGIVDTLLAEEAPDFSVFDADRAVVEGLLDSVGAALLSRSEGDFVESWYTLGRVSDIVATERDELIHIDQNSRIEFATAGPLSGTLVDGQVPSARERGATALSVRGTLSVAQTHSQAAPRGVLMRASVIYGRRAESTRAPLTVSLRDLPNVTSRPLPLRQLAALHETLPCSPKRLAPTHQRVGGAELRAFGFGDPKAPGAENGLLLGPGGADMTRPVLVNPVAGNGLGVVVGDSGAGKTFLCEVLAAQARMGGFRVLYLSGTPDAGSGFATLTGAPTWRPSQPGDLDPFRWAPQNDALQVHHALLTHLGTGLTEEEVSGLNSGVRRALKGTVKDLATVLQLADSTTAVAKVMRAARRDPLAGLLIAQQPPGAGTLPDAVQVDLSAVAPDPVMCALSVATLILHAARVASGPTFVVLDSVGGSLAHPLVEAALQVAQASPHVAVLASAEPGSRIGRVLGSSDHRYILSTSSEDAVRFAGPEPGPALMAWMADAGPVIVDGVVDTPAAGLYRSPHGSVSGFQMGPWPDGATPALTHGQAERYDTR